MVDTSVLHSLLFTKDNIIMDDWKLNTAPVLRLETPSKRFAHCVSAQCLLGLRGRSAPQSIRPGRSAPRPPHIHVFKGVTLRCGHRGFGLRLQFSLCYATLCYNSSLMFTQLVWNQSSHSSHCTPFSFSDTNFEQLPHFSLSLPSFLLNLFFLLMSLYRFW